MKIADKVRAILEAQQMKQADLADYLGVSQPTVNRWLGGTDPEKSRREQIEQMYSEIAGTRRNIVPLMGFVGAGAEIEPDFEQTPPEGLDQIEVPFPLPDEMIAFGVKGDSQFPVYRDGSIVIVFREQKRPLTSFYGEEVAVRTRDGRRFLKTIMRGSDGVTLTSWNAPPIENVHLEWIGEIFAVLPRSSLKKIEKIGGIQGRLPLKASK